MVCQKGGTGEDFYNDFVLNNNIILLQDTLLIKLILNNDTLRTSNN